MDNDEMNEMLFQANKTLKKMNRTEDNCETKLGKFALEAAHAPLKAGITNIFAIFGPPKKKWAIRNDGGVEAVDE